MDLIKYNQLTSLGNFYGLDICFEDYPYLTDIERLKNEWKPYNIQKPGYKREGLSLFSLNGETDGLIDLNSVAEYNRINNTDYDELSFRTPTKNWFELKSISEPLEELRPNLGRSHLIRLGEGGFFPPHRDLGSSFRLISILDGFPDSLILLQNDEKINFTRRQLYFMDTRLVHSIYSFVKNSVILVLNVELNDESINFVYKHLRET